MSKPLSEWTHRDFVEDLAQAKSHSLMEVPLGGMYKNSNKVPRADVVQINPAYDNFYVTIYEVKQDRGDILGSLESKKYLKYFDHCHRFYFACRKGIVKKSDIPEGIGLALRNENGWYSVQAGDIDKNHTIPRETLHAYLFQRVKYMHSMDRRDRIAKNFRWDRKLHRIGEEVSDAINFYDEFREVFAVAQKKGITSQEIKDLVMGLADSEDVQKQAFKFYRRYSYLIESIEEIGKNKENVEDYYFSKHHLRTLLRELRREERKEER